MRDPIRERDLEHAGAHQPVVDVDDKGTATITLKRDDLDLILQVPDRSAAYDAGYEKGYSAGRLQGLADAKQAAA